MAIWNKINKGLEDVKKSVTTQIETAPKNIGEFKGKASKLIEDAPNFISTKADELKSDIQNLTMEDVGNYAKGMGRLVSGIEAYEQRQAANSKKKEADKIMKETTDEIEKIRFLANSRLETFGRARCEMLKTTSRTLHPHS